MSQTPIQRFREVFNNDKLLKQEIHDYLSQSHCDTQLAVYKHRWFKYVRDKKQPHYDTIKFHFLYNCVNNDQELNRLRDIIKLLKSKQ